MKKVVMYEFVKRFNELEELEGFNFVKSIVKNYNQFKGEVEAIDKARSSNKAYNEYIIKSDNLLKDYAKKDEEGKPVVEQLTGGRLAYTIEKDTKLELETKLTELRDSSTDAIDNHNKTEEAFITDMDSEVEGNYNMIAEDDLPITITSKQLQLVNGFIEWNK